MLKYIKLFYLNHFVSAMYVWSILSDILIANQR